MSRLGLMGHAKRPTIAEVGADAGEEQSCDAAQLVLAGAKVRGMSM
jgi:hypothetical protein